jgi:pimeloyl-ACP methyl ester carboxylesterase
MAAMYPAHIRRLVLVGAAGLKPEKGEIADIFLMTPEEVQQRLFYDPSQAPEYDRLYGGELTLEQHQQAAWNREMAALLTWKPYMHNPKLPSLLAPVRVPTLLVWGKHDTIIPLNCGELYQAAIPGAQLTVIEHCGHAPQIEKPQEFLDAVVPFLTVA